ncbi:6713_t:CDS:2 [Acaulospora colombiana]|uniref:6713_t:CDS:1 n=1 Tax=Acaulospora colombiana TaxID=27376 RepID=A0ACA9KQH3_9GLOM|nr:6713_t:CDS:2 [Acaulospora colombiana]
MSDFTGRKILNSYFPTNLLFKTQCSAAPFVELTIIDRLRIALSNLERTTPHKILSPPHQKRRASVAIIIRIRSNPSYSVNIRTKTTDKIPASSSPSETSEVNSLEDFWKLPWVTNGIPEILYIKRALRNGDRWSGQMAFPGGKQDPEDVDDLDTAERETFEEVGLDLGNRDQFTHIGALDDLEVTTTFGKKLLMILCPFADDDEASTPSTRLALNISSTHSLNTSYNEFSILRVT